MELLQGTNFTEIKNIEIANAKPDDIMLLECIGFTSGVNLNGAIIEKAEALKSIGTLIGKPIRILFDGFNPTGHGYDPVKNDFSKEVQNIGYIHNANIIEENQEDYKAKVQAVIWKKYVPEIAERLVDLFNEKRLNFSIEAERDAVQTDEGYRSCKNINFRGLTIVQNPAWRGSQALMVAEELKGEEEKEMAEEVKETSKVEVKKEEDKEVNYKELYLNEKSANIILKTENETLTKDRDKYKDMIEDIKLKKLGEDRMSRLSKYGEVKEDLETLSKLPQEEYLNLFEKMLEDFKPAEKKEEKDDSNNQVNAYFTDVKKDTEDVSNKNALLDIFKGLSEK